MNIKEFLPHVDGFSEALAERDVLKRVFGDLSIPKQFAEKYVSLLHPKEIQCVVTDIRDETPSTKTFRLSPKGGYLPPFRAGQYINWGVTINNVKTGRAFSISSPPHQRGFYEITVRRMPDGFVSHYLLDEVSVGDEFTITGPAGSFYHEPLTDGDDLVFIAGGSGITPFMSIITEAVDRGLPLKISLIYGCRTPDDIIFGERLDTITKKYPNISSRIIISEPPKGYSGETGFITAEQIKKAAGNVAKKTFYLCGPELMYKFIDPELSKLKIPRRRLKHESYGPPTDITEEPGWPAEVGPDTTFTAVVNGGKKITVRATEPLLNSLERHGHTVPHLCRSGECSYCRVKIVSGTAFMPDRVAIRESDRWYNYVHSCLAYPVSDLEIRT
jgi:ferredoxin-NADP reductase